MFLSISEQTPCGVLFDVMKRQGKISHQKLASLILSEHSLADGRSPVSRASSDRTWVSHFIVHAPVGSLQARYFRDWGSAMQGVMGCLRLGGRKGMDAQQVIDMVCGSAGRAMDRALAACHQDAQLYRNALERFTMGRGYSTGERAEAVLLLFLAVGCSANVRASIAYAESYLRTTVGAYPATPLVDNHTSGCDEGSVRLPNAPRPLGLVRVRDGLVAGAPHWVAPHREGVVIGSLALGEYDVTDVASDVSARHAKVWWDEAGQSWLLRDLGSTNGTFVRGFEDADFVLVPRDTDIALGLGDEVRLGACTMFVVIEGAPDVLRTHADAPGSDV